MHRTLLAVLAISALPTATVSAETVGYTISGVTTANQFTSPAIPAEFPVGTPFTLTLQWESTSAPLFLSSSQGQYRLTEFTVSLAGRSGTWTTSALADKPSFTLNHLGGIHEIQFTSGWGPANHSNPTIEDLAPYSANLTLKDPTGTAIPTLATAPGSLALADWSANSYGFKLYLNEAGSASILGEVQAIRSSFDPEISIKLPNGKASIDGKSAWNFGKSKLRKKSKTAKFVIHNSGPVAIKGLKVGSTGKASKDFLLDGPTAKTLAPGASTVVKVRFKPTAKGKRKAILRVSHAASGKNPFDIQLSGKGLKP